VLALIFSGWLAVTGAFGWSQAARTWDGSARVRVRSTVLFESGFDRREEFRLLTLHTLISNVTLAQWLRSYFFGVGVGFRLVGGTSTQIGESWGNSDPCPSLLDGALCSSHPPNKEHRNCARGAVPAVPTFLAHGSEVSPAVPTFLAQRSEASSAVPAVPTFLAQGSEASSAVPAVPTFLAQGSKVSPAVPTFLAQGSEASPAVPAVPTLLPHGSDASPAVRTFLAQGSEVSSAVPAVPMFLAQGSEASPAVPTFLAHGCEASSAVPAVRTFLAPGSEVLPAVPAVPTFLAQDSEVSPAVPAVPTFLAPGSEASPAVPTFLAKGSEVSSAVPTCKERVERDTKEVSRSSERYCNGGGRSWGSQGTRVEGRQIPGARYIDTGCKNDGFRDDRCKASVVDYKRPGLGLRVR
jgi:hypothetical protein